MLDLWIGELCFNYALSMLCFVVDTEFSFCMGSEGCVNEGGVVAALCSSSWAWTVHGLHAKESRPGPSLCALHCAPALSNGSSYTHFLSFCLLTSPSLFIRAVFYSFFVTSVLHSPLVVLNFSSLMHLSMEYTYTCHAQKPIFFQSLKYIIPVLRTTPACAIKGPVL